VTRPPGTRVSDYEYDLPPDRIARYPAVRRDRSRLLVVRRDEDRLEHRVFREVTELFEPGDVLVLNESRVLPARLLGRKPTGAGAEVLLLRPHLPGRAGRVGARDVLAEPDAPGGRGVREPRGGPLLWEALVRPGGKLKPGRRVVVSDELEVSIVDSTPESGRIVRLETDLPVAEALARHGHVPLPPYLEREDEPLDRERYQTVYARTAGSVAAPTAGLHFTPELLADLRRRGVREARIVLHVGVGTFRPVETERPEEHEMHAEAYTVPEDAARTIEEARRRGGRVWAVGTTVVRTLETVAEAGDGIRAGSGATDLFIHPPHRFRAVDALITNFHLPRSTLLMLVAAFAGYRRTIDAYRAAVDEGYRFYSYGDAMAIL